MDFLLMIEGERQWFDPLRQSNLYLQKKNGKVVICKKKIGQRLARENNRLDIVKSIPTIIQK